MRLVGLDGLDRTVSTFVASFPRNGQHRKVTRGWTTRGRFQFDRAHRHRGFRPRPRPGPGRAPSTRFPQCLVVCVTRWRTPYLSCSLSRTLRVPREPRGNPIASARAARVACGRFEPELLRKVQRLTRAWFMFIRGLRMHSKPHANCKGGINGARQSDARAKG